MKVWYCSEQRFINRIVKKWHKSGVKFNAGNVNILRFAFRAVLYWSNLQQQKVSKANRHDIHPKLF